MSQQKNTHRGKIFSERLEMLRKGRKKAHFARILGINSPVTYQNYEDGRVPDALMLEQIADTCMVTVDWLLGRTETGGPPGSGDESAEPPEPDLPRSVRESPADYTRPLCRVPADCDLPARIAHLESQCSSMQTKLDTLCALLGGAIRSGLDSGRKAG